MNLKSAVKSATTSLINKAKDKLSPQEKKDLIFGDGELKKAHLQYMSTLMSVRVDIPVQFNPTNFKITRTTKAADNNKSQSDAIAHDTSPDDMGASSSGPGALTMNLTLDNATEYPDYMVKSGTRKYIEGDTELSDILADLALLTKIYPKTHTQSTVHFVWGSLDFYGVVSSLDITYSMFNRNGQPVRAEITMTIVGEDKRIMDKLNEKPKESPDRTKVRNLQQRDELWMLAAEEYDDPSAWKEIAKANGILNPRKVDYTKGLKVPSI